MIINKINKLDEEKDLLLVNKKKQKNFVNLINYQVSKDKQGTN